MKFFRCENPSQRLLGINMMCGLLRKREQAVSLEAYSVMTTPSAHSCALARASEGMITKSKMINTDDIMNSDYGRLQLAFSAVYNHAVMTIAQSVSTSSGKSAEECSLLLSQWIKKLAEHDEAARLRYSHLSSDTYDALHALEIHHPLPHHIVSHYIILCNTVLNYAILLCSTMSVSNDYTMHNDIVLCLTESLHDAHLHTTTLHHYPTGACWCMYC